MTDTLASRGYLKKKDLEKNIEREFSYKPQGKAEIKELTANAIKNRRRNMKGDSRRKKECFL